MDRTPWDRALPSTSSLAPHWDSRPLPSSSSATFASHQPMLARAPRDPRLGRSPSRDPRVSRSPPRGLHLRSRSPLRDPRPRSPLRDPRMSHSPPRDLRFHPSHDRDQAIHHPQLDNQQQQLYQHESPVHFQSPHIPQQQQRQQQYRPHESPVHSQHPPLHVTLPPRARDDASSTAGSVTSGELSSRELVWKRKRLLRKKVLPLNEFKRIRKLKLKLEVVKDGEVVPIPVALEPSESEQEYEALLQEWLRGRGVDLKNLRDEPDRERIYRTAYANLRTTSYYKPRASKDAHSADYESRGRAMENGNGEQGGGYVRKRSLSPHSDSYDRPPHKVYVKHHSQHSSSSSSSRDHHYNGSTTRQRSRSPPSTHSPSGSAKRCKAKLPAPKSSFRSFVNAYVKCYCFNCLRDWNLMLTERLEDLETEVRYLRKRVPDDRAVVDKKTSHRDHLSQEAKKLSPKESSGNKAGTNSYKEPSSTKTCTSGVKEPSAKTGTSGLKDSSRSAKAVTDDQQKQKPATKAVSESKSCTSSPKCTPASSGTEVSKKDSEAKQNPESVLDLALLSASRDTGSLVNPTATSSSNHDRAFRDSIGTELVSNVVQSHDQKGDQATTTSQSRSGSSAEIQAETPTTSQKVLDATGTASEPISSSADQAMTDEENSLDELMIERSVKAQMTGDYDSLNQQILNNEKILHDAVEQLQQRMVTDMHGALRQQEQIHQLRQSIFDDMVHRDAAMAMLIAYCWMDKHDELKNRIAQLDTLDVPHVQRVSHVKCAELASQIAEKTAEIALLQVRLSAATTVNDGDGTSMVDNLRVVEDLSTEIVHIEAALAALEEERMEQCMRLFQFSHRIRATCKSMLEA